ncbi:MAG: NADH-quinone oxidoreductase subunit J family protein [Myxococcaceae bacterium]
MAETTEKTVVPGRHVKLVATYAGLVVMVAVLFAEVTMLLPGLSRRGEGLPLFSAGDAAFYLMAAVTMVSAVAVAFSKSIIYSAMALLGALLGAGGLYVFLHADFVAITQLLIYIGGVLVLILFAVMLTSRIGGDSATNPSVGKVPGIGLLIAVTLVLGFAAAQAPWKSGGPPVPLEQTAEKIGDLFLGQYLIAFEVISLLLLATLIGAVVVARKEIKE